MSTSPISMPGLVTGLDTTSLIQQLMAVERQPVNALQTRQAKTQNQLDAYRTLNTKLMALQTAAKNLMGVTKNLSPFSAMQATSSNTSSFTASVSGTASPGTYSVNVQTLATFQSYGGGAFTGGQAGTFTIKDASGNTATINVAAGDTAQNIADQINANVSSGMNATVVGGNLLLSAKNSGTAGNCTITQTAGGAGFMGAIGLTGGTAGTDAQITVNGITETSSTNTFKNALTGVDITAVTAATSGTVTVANDFSQVTSDVQDLVNKFNDVIKTISDDTAYDSSSKKGGVLVGDAYVENLASQLTQQITGAFDTTAYNTTAGQLPGLRNYTDVGISVQKDGTLTLDTAKLQSALQNYSQQSGNSASAYQLFSNEDGKTMADGTWLNDAGVAGNTGSQANWGDGIANRISAFVDQLISPSSMYNSPDPSGGRYQGGLLNHMNTLTAQITDYGNQISAYNDRLANYQRYLQSMFNNMETQVAQLRNQGNYLAGQTGGTASAGSSGG